jgi:hypothetical protein
MTTDIAKFLSAEINLEFLVEFSHRHVRMAAVVTEWEKAGRLTVERLESSDFTDWLFDGLERESRHLVALGSILRSKDFSRLSGDDLAADIKSSIAALEAFIVYNNFVNTSDFYHNILTTKLIGILDAALPQGGPLTAATAYSALTTPETTVWIQEEDDDLKTLTTDALDKLAALLDEGHSDRLTALLKTMARFHKYSWHNVALIASQCPTATRVAGFQTWRTLGRFVRKGEKGIAVLAPIVTRRHSEDVDEDGKSVVGFRAVHVFDHADRR